MRYRLLNWWIARRKGFFWLPCPSCGQDFGGHEWTGGDYSAIPEDAEGIYRTGVCPDCAQLWREEGSLPI